MVNTTQSRGDTAYNPQGDADAYDDNAQSFGGDNQPTNRDYEREDAEADQSERTGSIPKGEVEDLKASQFPGEGEVSSYTRGNHVDVFKNEREIDSSFKAAGIPTEEDANGEDY